MLAGLSEIRQATWFVCSSRYTRVIGGTSDNNFPARVQGKIITVNSQNADYAKQFKMHDTLLGTLHFINYCFQMSVLASKTV